MSGVFPLIILIALVILGLVYCFGGYRYFKIVLFFYLLYVVYSAVSGFLNTTFPELGNTAIIIALALGLIAGALTLFFAKFAIFMVGGIVGLLLYRIVRSANPSFFAPLPQVNIILIGLICFIIMGVIMLALQRHLLIIFTAIFGAYSLVVSGGLLIGVLMDLSTLQGVPLAGLMDTLEPYSIFIGQARWVKVLPIVIFSIAGMITQYRKTARGRR